MVPDGTSGSEEIGKLRLATRASRQRHWFYVISADMFLFSTVPYFTDLRYSVFVDVLAFLGRDFYRIFGRP